jgi:hypothetical protein
MSKCIECKFQGKFSEGEFGNYIIKHMLCQAPGGGPTQDPISLNESIREYPCEFFQPITEKIGPQDKTDSSSEISELINELIEIGKNYGFLSSVSGGKLNDNGRNIRAREIGARLHELGGFNLMQEVYYSIRNSLNVAHAAELEVAWKSIGLWQ